MTIDKKPFLERLVLLNEEQPVPQIEKILGNETARQTIKEYEELSMLVSHVQLTDETNDENEGYRELVKELKKFVSIFRYSKVKEKIHRIVEVENRNAYDLLKAAVLKATPEEMQSILKQIHLTYFHIDFFKTFVVQYGKEIPQFFAQYGLKTKFEDTKEFIESAYLFIGDANEDDPSVDKELSETAKRELLGYNTRAYLSNLRFAKEKYGEFKEVSETDIVGSFRDDPESLYQTTRINLMSLRNVMHKNVSDLVILLQETSAK